MIEVITLKINSKLVSL